jgi:hypothetical protein
MNLLLAINRERQTTCIMVCLSCLLRFADSFLFLSRFATEQIAIFSKSYSGQVTHNPDLECYADRVLYLQDGRIVK